MAKSGKKPPTKTEVLTSIAEATDLSKKEVASVFESLADQIKKNIGGRGPGTFTSNWVVMLSSGCTLKISRLG